MVRLIRRYFGGICSHLYVISIIYIFIVNKNTSNNNLLNTYLCQASCRHSWIVQWITHVVAVSLQKFYEVKVTHSRSHSQRAEDLESEPRSDRLQTPPSCVFVKYCYIYNMVRNKTVKINRGERIRNMRQQISFYSILLMTSYFLSKYVLLEILLFMAVILVIN